MIRLIVPWAPVVCSVAKTRWPVSAAVMGFDPAAVYPSAPFLRSDNHLALADAVGLGPHRLEEIEVVGTAIGDVRYEFRPCWG